MKISFVIIIKKKFIPYLDKNILFSEPSSSDESEDAKKKSGLPTIDDVNVVIDGLYNQDESPDALTESGTLTVENIDTKKNDHHDHTTVNVDDSENVINEDSPLKEGDFMSDKVSSN